MGLEITRWGYSKTDGVPVGLVESQWSCLESQWGRLSMGMLQGVGGKMQSAVQWAKPSWAQKKNIFEIYHRKLVNKILCM